VADVYCQLSGRARLDISEIPAMHQQYSAMLLSQVPELETLMLDIELQDIFIAGLTDEWAARAGRLATIPAEVLSQVQGAMRWIDRVDHDIGEFVIIANEAAWRRLGDFRFMVDVADDSGESSWTFQDMREAARLFCEVREQLKKPIEDRYEWTRRFNGRNGYVTGVEMSATEHLGKMLAPREAANA
jgi:hypothetical protein